MEVDYLKSCNLCGGNQLIAIDEKNGLYKCLSCGFVFDNPRPTISEIINYYSRQDKYDTWLSEEQARGLLWQKRLAIVRKYKKNGKLLDVGAGVGQFLSLAKQYFEVMGTEVSKSACKISQEKYGVVLIEGEIDQVAFDELFDIVTMFHVLEHVPNPLLTLKRCRELLKPGGILLIAVPNDLFSLHSFIKRLCALLKIGRFKNYGNLGLPRLVLDGSLSEIHLSHFAPYVLSKVLEKNGFDVLTLTLDPYYAVIGKKKILHDLIYFVSLAIDKLFKKNIYNTMLAVAKKKNNI